MSLHCKKCLCGRSGDVVGAPCKSPGCDGTIEVAAEWKDLVNPLPETMTCGSRMNEWGPWDHKAGLDHWDQFKRNGDRVCSFCGSLHPEDFFRLAKQSAEASEDTNRSDAVEIECSTKTYKIYVTQPGVRNAHEGGIKFYTWHMPRNAAGEVAVTSEQDKDFAVARYRSRIRFEHSMARTRENR